MGYPPPPALAGTGGGVPGIPCGRRRNRPGTGKRVISLQMTWIARPMHRRRPRIAVISRARARIGSVQDTGCGGRIVGKRGSSRRRERLRRHLELVEDVCWLGLEPLDFAVTDPNDMRHVEIDEEIPVSLGGSPLDPENCHLVCRRHNLEKGNRVLARGSLANSPGGVLCAAGRGRCETSREWF